MQQKWALVVGIGHFTDSEIPRLNYTTADATAFAAALEDPSIGQFPADNVHVLTDEQATTKNIKEQLNWIARHAAPNDLVVIYVATHGTSRTMDTAGGANYLVTYDTEAYNGAQLRRGRALCHGLSHGGAGQRRGHAHEGPAHRGLSRHLLQRRRGRRAARPRQQKNSPTPPRLKRCWRTCLWEQAGL